MVFLPFFCRLLSQISISDPRKRTPLGNSKTQSDHFVTIILGQENKKGGCFDVQWAPFGHL